MSRLLASGVIEPAACWQLQSSSRTVDLWYGHQAARWLNTYCAFIDATVRYAGKARTTATVATLDRG